MRICYFGIYNPEYARNKVLISGLKENNCEVIECNVNPKEVKGIKKYWELIKKYKSIQNKNFDYLIVGYPGQTTVWLAKLLYRGSIIFDAFFSVYDSLVYDRQSCKPYSLLGIWNWFLDWHSCLLADKILLDTNEHIKYFIKEFKIKKEKFIRVFVGSNEKYFFPSKKENDKSQFIVHFHGNNLPLQGVGYIIQAAELLKNDKIHFNIIGSAIKREYRDYKFDNITFINQVPYKELSSYINSADICLGIFGDRDKTKRVIPNKIYESIAVNKPVLTADTLAIREVFENKKNILLCKVADAQDIADKILEFKNDKELRKRISARGYELFRKELMPKEIVANLLKNLE